MTDRKEPTFSPTDVRRQNPFLPERVWLKLSIPILIVSLTVLIGALGAGAGSRSMATGLDGHLRGDAAQAGSQQEIWGDADCSGSIDPIDSLKILRNDAGLSSPSVPELCPEVGSIVAVNGVIRVWGDGDCSAALSPVDSLKTLRFDAGLSAPKIDPTCPDFGGLVTVGDPSLPLLNEVRFSPGPGNDTFVELKSSGGMVEPSGLRLVNERDEEFIIPNSDPFVGNTVLLLEFGNSDFIDPDSGFVELRDGGDLLDRVAWGEDFADAVNLSNGSAMSAPLPAGASIGRPPGANSPRDRLQWAVFYDDASPGSPNPNVPIGAQSPPDGAWIETDENTFLTWQPVVGAAEYAVQVAPAANPSSPIINETVDRARVTIGALADGEYVWTVQPIGDAGDPAPISDPIRFVVGDLPFAVAPAGNPGSEALLDVEFITAKKDTSMLLLEAQESFDGLGGDHFWDAPHGSNDIADPADRMGVEASVVMVNAYLGGNVSQDRLGYEAFKDRAPGPERDFNFGDALSLNRTQRIVEFAFGGFNQICSDDEDALWNFVKESIDADLPLIGFRGPGSSFDPNAPPTIDSPWQTVQVITGYHVTDPSFGLDSERLVGVNDPTWYEPFATEFKELYYGCLWRPAGAAVGFTEEASVTADSDGDGIVDFDEIMRFQTDPYEIDTDEDGLTDKEEVNESIYGLLANGVPDPAGRDWDKDGTPMELDCDSDNDGIMDGEDFDSFSPVPGPGSAACAIPEAYIGSTSFALQGDATNPVHTAYSDDVLFVRDAQDPMRYEAVSGTLTYSIEGPSGFSCEVSGMIEKEIVPGDASFDLFFPGPPAMIIGRTDSDLSVPVMRVCGNQEPVEEMWGARDWFFEQGGSPIANPNRIEGEYAPDFAGNPVWTWDLRRTAAPP